MLGKYFYYERKRWRTHFKKLRVLCYQKQKLYVYIYATITHSLLLVYFFFCVCGQVHMQTRQADARTCSADSGRAVALESDRNISPAPPSLIALYPTGCHLLYVAV